METVRRKRNPRGREARKQDKRQAILSIAERCFLAKGYSGTSMSAIAAELGGSKTTVWNHFSSKEALFATVVEATATEFRQGLVDLLVLGDDLRETLTGFTRSLVRRLLGQKAMELHRLVIAESKRFPEVGEIFYRLAPAPTIELLAAFVAREIDGGRLEADDPYLAARALLSLCVYPQQSAMCGVGAMNERAMDRHADFAVAIFLRAFSPTTA